MAELSSNDARSRIDWNRIEAWAQQLADGDTHEVSAAFEANATAVPRLWWRPRRAQLQTSELRFLLRYWTGLKAGTALPKSDRVDFGELTPILGHETIVDAVDDGRDFRYRRVSTAMTALVGDDMTGTLISTLPLAPHMLEGILALYRAVRRRGDPAYIERAPAGPVFESHALVLPLADASEKIESFLVGIIPIGSDGLPIYRTA